MTDWDKWSLEDCYSAWFGVNYLERITGQYSSSDSHDKIRARTQLVQGYEKGNEAPQVEDHVVVMFSDVESLDIMNLYKMWETELYRLEVAQANEVIGTVDTSTFEVLDDELAGRYHEWRTNRDEYPGDFLEVM